jgi:hypothetical protein
MGGIYRISTISEEFFKRLDPYDWGLLKDLGILCSVRACFTTNRYPKSSPLLAACDLTVLVIFHRNSCAYTSALVCAIERLHLSFCNSLAYWIVVLKLPWLNSHGGYICRTDTGA